MIAWPTPTRDATSEIRHHATATAPRVPRTYSPRFPPGMFTSFAATRARRYDWITA